MCGLAGYIGESKKPVLTYQLITNLFEQSETRGVDAAGFWGTESGPDGSVLYHKEPGKASYFIKKDMWKQISKHNPNMLLVHARGASKGVGEPTINQNNHPFTSLDKSIGLIHNGRVDDCEYNSLKQKYGLCTQCDSEIILRIFESGEHYNTKELKETFGDIENSRRLAGIRDVFSLINEGHMAVAIGERGEDGNRMLWLFRNHYRPLWIVDMRESLGQVFFVSEPSIWEDAVADCSGVKSLAKTQKLIELPEDEVWQFKITKEKIYPENVQKYEVCKNELTPWQYDGKKYLPILKNPSFQVVTRLDEQDKIIQKTKKTEPLVEWFDSSNYGAASITEVNRKCAEIVDLVNNIQQYAEQLVHEQSISVHELQQLLQDLEQQRQDMEGLTAIIGR